VEETIWFAEKLRPARCPVFFGWFLFEVLDMQNASQSPAICAFFGAPAAWTGGALSVARI
jgi:hypothetical protein